MNALVNRVGVRQQVAWTTYFRPLDFARAAAVHLMRRLSHAREFVMRRARRVERPHEVVLTIAAIIFIILFVYLLVATPFTQYGW